MLLSFFWFSQLYSGVVAAHSCSSYGQYRGSEDSTLWRDGIAFQSSGLERPSPRYNSSAKHGKILIVDLKGPVPALSSVPLHGIPYDYDFRPHGIHIDNVTQRLYAVSHSLAEQKEETVAVFQIYSGLNHSDVELHFKYALTSPRFEYYGVDRVWFLNDVVSVDGKNELYVTQFGPISPNPNGKRLFRCTWDEASVMNNGRNLATCDHAVELTSQGLNGINIDPTSTRLWVNDLYMSRLWVFDRMPNGTLVKHLDDIELPGMIDNVEHDFASGDLTMGMFSHPGSNSSEQGGSIVAKCTNVTYQAYAPASIVTLNDLPSPYQVSTSLVYKQWTILGSPWDTGLVICEHI